MSELINTANNPVRLFVDNRNYICWKIYNLDTKEEIITDVSLNPIEKRLFNNDIIYENGELVYSSIRECPTIAGILLLENNKTYGRTENKKRLLYKCIPDDKRLPSFLIPYDIKMNFSKKIYDKYVVFKFDSWNHLHPIGSLVEVLGDTTNLEAFYEYKLYCRNLNISNKEFTKKTHKLFHTEKTHEYIQHILHNPNFVIENRTDHCVFTIDPKNSLDYYDGFGITRLSDGSTKISIYIANVFFWIETFGLWESFQKRVSTIYLPDRRRPMLPTTLSDNLCSLLEKQDRFAFCMDILLDVDQNITKIDYSNVLINVAKNFIYEESALLKNKDYKIMYEITKKMDQNIVDSHGVVAFWMIFMNKSCGSHMFSHNVGIYRTVLSKYPTNGLLDIQENQSISSETKRIIQNWRSVSGQYVLFNEGEHLDHDILNIKKYVHITSPIRRLVDLLNQIIFFVRFSLIKNISKEGTHFLNEWVSEIETLNDKMKSTLKIERECEIMRKCLTRPEILTHYHEAYVIGIREIFNTPFLKYTVYIENEKMILEFKSEQKKEIYKMYKIKLYNIDSYGVMCKIKIGWADSCGNIDN